MTQENRSQDAEYTTAMLDPVVIFVLWPSHHNLTVKKKKIILKSLKSK